ncbi:MAG: tRNA pseudouridine(38-40) synthase TruA [Oscillospiraceae bacterium]|jgi:tRNA pseudouridine38-40 synthase|nr:tRNA pseudouridine(38-40) synthase TruA [Oscillospiraceae bacterium]
MDEREGAKRRIRMVVAYDGTRYAGFQLQLGVPSIQGELEKALGKLLGGSRTVVFGASRTDGGVHAEGQVVHFDMTGRIPAEKIAFALNTMLPDDIRVTDSRRAADGFHARFHATGKLYRYSVWNARHASPLHRLTHAHVPVPLDMDAMRSEALTLVGEHDFRAFQAAGAAGGSTRRRVHRVRLYQQGPHIELLIHGNAFLYNMVRIVAGTLMDVGRGQVLPGAVARALTSGDRLDLGVTAPARGLTLLRVFYADDDQADAYFGVPLR